MSLNVKRVYEDASNGDGYRVLVDRLWPRGMTTEAAEIDLWLKDAAPSHELRRAYHAGQMEFPAFEAAYRDELGADPGVLDVVRDRLARGETVTLLYASKDTEQNHAAVLREVIESNGFDRLGSGRAR